MIFIIANAITSLYAIFAAISWHLAFLKNPIRFASILIIVAAIVHWQPYVPAIYSAALLILSIIIVQYAVHAGWLIRPRKSPKIGTYIFSYKNAKGEHTRRKVDVEDLWYEDETGYFSGYCHRSKANRTFRLDRVCDNVIDTNTGEILTIDP